jgi:Ca2+-binding EF-hand superfamily protein
MMNKTALISISVLGLMFSLGTYAQTPQTGTDNTQNPAARAAEQRAQRFAELDSNADGNISYEEFRAAPLAAFQQQDTDGDGNISREEAVERRFLQLDGDNNGLLTVDEMSRSGRGAEQGQPRGQGNRQGGGPVAGQGGGERMRNMTPEQREQMRERMQQMTPEQREQMREQMQNAPRRQQRQVQGSQQGGQNSGH